MFHVSNLRTARISMFSDGPENATITGPGAAAQVGDTFLCASDSNPRPNYQWRRLAGTGPDSVDGDTLTVDDTMSSPSRYQCVASNDGGSGTAQVEFLVGTHAVVSVERQNGPTVYTYKSLAIRH
jgi:hypothetical protein